MYFNFGQFEWRGDGTTNKVVWVNNPSTSTWHYLVGTITGTSAVLYLDGASVASGTVDGIPGNTNGINLGRYTEFGGGYYLNGSLDEVRISNTALSSGRIATEYNNVSNAAFLTAGTEQ